MIGHARRIGVLIVDDHDLFRTGLATMLQAEKDIEVVAQASLGQDGRALGHESCARRWS